MTVGKETNAGLALTMGGLATLLVMPVAGFLTGKVDPRYLIGCALAFRLSRSGT